MNKTILIKTILPCSLLLLAACGVGDKSQETATTEYIDVAADIDVRATNDFEVPSKIIEATFIPNIIAGWATQLVLIDEAGALLRTQMDKPIPKAFSDGPFTDIQGLGRKGQAGVLLALSESGSLQAFIEVSDEGDFKRIPVSMPDLKITSFCNTSNFTEPLLHVKTSEGESVNLEIAVENNTQITLTKKIENQGSDTLCQSDSVRLSADLNLVPNPNGPHLVIRSELGDSILEISDGLSIRGIENPDVIAIIDTNLGSTFNKGALLVSDSNSNRIVLIARDYLIDVINAPTD